MKPALAQVCSLNSPLEADVADYAAGKCEAIELWTGKLDVVCKKVLFFWTKCDPPSGVHVAAFYSAN